MGKGSDKKLNRVLLVLAVVSFVITFLEGMLYYDATTYSNPLFRYMLIVQNSIKAFGFRSTIGVESVMRSINSEMTAFELFVSYAYTFATFTAPYCTAVVVYKVLAHWFRIKGWHVLHILKRHIIVFGYNEASQNLLMNCEPNKEELKKCGYKIWEREKLKYKIHLVATDVPHDAEMELLKRGIEIHKVDCLKLPPAKLNYAFKRMELERALAIILFEDSAAKNFSLYHMFHTEQEKVKIQLHKDVKFFARCEDDSIHRMMEDYFDEMVKNNAGEEQKKSFGDLELVNVTELRIREMLAKHKLHQYYLDKKVADPNQWHLHLLIVGFGKVGQELLRQAMNQGVTGSDNRILVDVVDYNIEQKKKMFANNFDAGYVEMGKDEFKIPSNKADGELRIRFHQMDIRYKNFEELLNECGNPETDGIFTYVAICITSADLTLHSMTEIDRYFTRHGHTGADRVSGMAIRMDLDKQMSRYLDDNKGIYKNVFVIGDNAKTITMQTLLNDGLDKEAKAYHNIYSSITVKIGSSDILQRKNSPWSDQKLVRRNSSRAAAQHEYVKNDVYDLIEKVDLEQYFGANGSVFREENGSWISDMDMEEFVKVQSDRENYRLLSEISRLEHRRWCYFMASCGWKRTQDPTAEKKDATKENPCMCTWEELVRYRSGDCPYDLMSLLLKYKEEKAQK